MTNFQNDQESIVHEIMQLSLGGWGAFAPACYAGTKEPADVAWVSGDTCILIYCMKGNKSRILKDEKNIRQASGWIRKWKSGIRLVGKNEHYNFNLPYQDVKDAKILSITDNFDCDGLSISKMTSCGRSVVCMPHKVFMFLLEKGINAKDLCAIMSVVEKSGEIEFDIFQDLIDIMFKGLFESGIKSINSIFPLNVKRDRDEISILVSKIKSQSKFDVRSFDLSFSEICWVSGVIEAGKQFVAKSFEEHGQLGFAYACESAFESETFVAICANQDVANGKLHDWNKYWSKPSANFIQVVGGYPDCTGSWSYYFVINGTKSIE